MGQKKQKSVRELIVKSSTNNLSIVRDFIKSAAEEAGFSKEATGKIILAVDEACTNIIKHAYKFSSSGEIEITTSRNDNNFKISVTDKGLHFDAYSIEEPDLIEYHQKKRVGGLGMFLMKKLMDEVQYKILSDNRNQVVLVKKYE